MKKNIFCCFAFCGVRLLCGKEGHRYLKNISNKQLFELAQQQQQLFEHNNNNGWTATTTTCRAQKKQQCWINSNNNSSSRNNNNFGSTTITKHIFNRIIRRWETKNYNCVIFSNLKPLICNKWWPSIKPKTNALCDFLKLDQIKNYQLKKWALQNGLRLKSEKTKKSKQIRWISLTGSFSTFFHN